MGCGSGGPIPQMSFHSSSQAAGADPFLAVLFSGRGQKYRAEGFFLKKKKKNKSKNTSL